MRDEPLYRPSRGARSQPPSAATSADRRRPLPPSGRGTVARGDATENPYRSYQPYGSAGPAQSAPRPPSRRALPPAPGDADEWDVAAANGWTTGHAALGHSHRFALFHDGNAGHIWRADVASTLGEAMLSAGALMWLAVLPAASASAVVLTLLLGVLALALPWLVAAPLAVRLQNVAEPGRPLARLGQLRCLLALGLIAMHFHTILPVVYLLLFAISLCGRLRAGLRVAAMRACLAPGEPERVADDGYIGAVFATILGPLAAMLLFALLGERIPLVALGASICFLLCANSDGFLDAIPPSQRAYLLAVPEQSAVRHAQQLAGDDDDDMPQQAADLGEAAQRLREQALPEWYSHGPTTAAELIADLKAGLGLAGTQRPALAAVLALTALGLVGGGLGVLDVLYVTLNLELSSFYLGALLAAEAFGLAVGALLATEVLDRVAAATGLVLGLLLAGVGLFGLAVFDRMPHALILMGVLGIGNALAASSAHRLLTAPFFGADRRAVATAERALGTVSLIVGAGAFAVIYGGPAVLGLHARWQFAFGGWPLAELLMLTSGGLLAMILVVLAALALPTPQPATASQRKGKRGTGARTGTARRADADGFDDDDEEDAAPPRRYPARRSDHPYDDSAYAEYAEYADAEDDRDEPYDDRDFTSGRGRNAPSRSASASRLPQRRFTEWDDAGSAEYPVGGNENDQEPPSRSRSRGWR